MASLSEVITELQQSQDNLLEISMESLDAEDRSYQVLSGIYDCVKRIEDVLVEATVHLYDFFDMQSERVEAAKELQSTQKLDELETQREDKKSEKPQKDSDKSLVEKITPSKGLFDIASKFLMGTAVFWMLNNIEEVEAFINDQLIPAIKSTFAFMKDTLFPFFKDNFKIFLGGLMTLAGVIVGGKIISVIASAIDWIRKARIALIALSSSMSGLATTLGSAAVAAAPFVAIGIAIGVALFGLYKLLEHLKEKLQFDSIGDVLMYGVLQLKDSFARMGNLIIDVVNKFGGLLEAGARILGKDIDLPELQRMETNSAEQYRQRKDDEREARESSEQSTQSDSSISLDDLPNYEDIDSVPKVVPKPKPKPTPPTEKELPEGVVKDPVSGKYIGTHAEANARSMFDTVSEAEKFVNAPLEQAAKMDSTGTVARIYTERQELKSQMATNLNNLKPENTARRAAQTQQLNTVTTENQIAKSEMNNSAPTIVAPSTNNNVVNNNMKQTVSMPMPTASDGSDRYAPLFGAR